MLISDIATIVQNSIGDRGGIMAKDDLVIFWVNEAILDIFRKTEIGRENIQTTLLPYAPDSITVDEFTDPFYPPFGITVGALSQWVPANDLLRIHFVHNGEYEMEETTLDKLLDWYGPDYIITRGTPRYFYRGYEEGVTVVNFVPPTDEARVITLSATYIPTRFTLTSQDTSTVVPPSYDNDVIRFCIMRAHELEKDFQASSKAQEHYNNNMFERADEAHALDDSYSTISADEWDFM